MRQMLLVLAFVLAGCGGPPREAQAVLTVTAIALRTADGEVATRYQDAAHDARETSGSWADYDRAMGTWNDVETALRTAHEALLATQAGLDAWRDGSDAGWTASVPCLVEAIDRLRLLLDGLGVHLTPLASALAIAAPFAGTCGP